MGYETDTGKMKVGDGSTSWSSLYYFPSSLQFLQDVDTMSPSDNDVLTYDTATGMWSSQAAAGGTIYTVQTKTSAYTASEGEVVLASGTFIVKLPSSHDSGDYVVVKNLGSNTITVSSQGGDTIDGSTSSNVSYLYQSIKCLSDGSNWYLI